MGVLDAAAAATPSNATGPYEGIRVVSLAQSVTATVASSLLATLGARVILVEPPEGSALRRLGPFPEDVPDREKSAAFLHLARGFESVTLDLSRHGGRSLLASICRGADLVIEEEPPSDARCVRETLRAAREREDATCYSIVSLSPFGLTGPWAERPSSQLVMFALSGLMANVGEATREPLQLPDSLIDSFEGVAAFTAATGALEWQARTGEPHDVDCAAFDILASSNPHAISRFSYTGLMQKRVGNLLPQGYPWTLLPCKDGHIGVIAPDRDWDVFCLWMERPDLTQDPRFATRVARSQHIPELEAVLTEWTMRYTKEELYREGQLRHLPFGAVLTIEDSLQSVQLVERGFLRAIESGDCPPLLYAEPPFVTGENRPSLEPAPALGRDTAKLLREFAGIDTPVELTHLRQEGVL